MKPDVPTLYITNQKCLKTYLFTLACTQMLQQSFVVHEKKKKLNITKNIRLFANLSDVCSMRAVLKEWWFNSRLEVNIFPLSRSVAQATTKWLSRVVVRRPVSS